MLSELRFGALLSYLPKATTEAETNAKKWMSFIKGDKVIHVNGRPGTVLTSTYLAEGLASKAAADPVRKLFDGAILVPVPGSGLLKTNSLWVPERLARALLDVGLGSHVVECVRRTKAVPKSAFARPGERPTVADHYASFAVDRIDLTETRKFILIDDVVTKGATMLAAAQRLQEAFPLCTLGAFAMLRTMGYKSQFVKLFDPVIGQITLDRWGNAHRDP